MKTSHNILAFAASVEIATGLGLLVVPGIVIFLLMGAEPSGGEILLGRFLGIALVALGIACWPARQHGRGVAAPMRAILGYNALVAAYLFWLGAAENWAGWLLWPAVVLHAIVALLLAWRA